MTAHLDVVDGALLLDANPRDKDRIKENIAGATVARGTSSTWRIPLGLAGCVAARGVFGGGLSVGRELADWSVGERERLAGLLAMKSAPVVSDSPVFADLYGFQASSVRWMGTAGRALNTDDMGLGKTIQSARTLLGLAGARPADIWPALVICPNNMKLTWASELERWGPANGGIVVIGGTPTQKKKQFAAFADGASIAVVNWEALFRHSRLAPYGSTRLSPDESTPKELNEIGFKIVIADEAHRAISPAAKQTRAWWHLSHAATFSYALTGTPLSTSPADLWSILHGLFPEEFPRKTAFVSRYCHAGQNMHGGYEVYGFRADMKAELFSFLDPRMIRRTGEEVGLQLPEKVYSRRLVELDPKQRKAYDTFEKEMLLEVDGDFVLADSPLTLAGRLLGLAAAMPVVEEGEIVAFAKPSCKLDALLEILDEIPQDEAVIVWAASRKLIALCADELRKKKITFVELSGRYSITERGQSEALFRDGEARVALCTFDAVSEGVTLNRARHAVFLQRSNKMIQNRQAEKRNDRIGQEASVINIIDVVSADTVEEDVHERDGIKTGFLEEVLRDRARNAQPVRRNTERKAK